MKGAQEDAADAGTADGAAMSEASGVPSAAAIRSRFRIFVCMVPMIRMHTTNTAGHIASTAKIEADTPGYRIYRLTESLGQ